MRKPNIRMRFKTMCGHSCRQRAILTHCKPNQIALIGPRSGMYPEPGIRISAMDLSVTVATVERGLRLTGFCSIAMAGLNPPIKSTLGFSICPMNCRAKVERDST